MNRVSTTFACRVAESCVGTIASYVQSSSLGTPRETSLGLRTRHHFDVLGAYRMCKMVVAESVRDFALNLPCDTDNSTNIRGFYIGLLRQATASSTRMGTDVFVSGLFRSLKNPPPRGDKVLLTIEEGEKEPDDARHVVRIDILSPTTTGKQPEQTIINGRAYVQAKIFVCIHTEKAIATHRPFLLPTGSVARLRPTETFGQRDGMSDGSERRSRNTWIPSHVCIQRKGRPPALLNVPCRTTQCTLALSKL
ncbi:hypothetical protein E2C01_036508 [Portunus trituberculatus]|uniref:Uncharacterized protein n=1 Tax=Portunus trituberculatus TaxID=210409 RepID=A0A5B7FC43_PORTR|nr:hypothetical protein [Portunus trituberculatus]